MSNAAQQVERDEALLEAGYVVTVHGEKVVVDLGDCRVDARRAAGCLREPQAGDRVLAAHLGAECFVLSVLEARDPETARVAVDGDLELAARSGSVRVAAQQGVEVVTAGEATVTAPRGRLRVVDVEAAVDRLRWLGRKVHADIQAVTLVAGTIDSLAERVRERAERAYRFIKDFDQLRAGHIDHRARETVRVHGENTVVTANKLAKIDGDQIHVG